MSEGDILADKYRVERILGAGGMGVVVAARHLRLDQRVAIKFLLPEALDNAEVVARFAREARAAVKIQSEHVARIIDVGELEDGAPYIVMEYLEGSDLAEVSRQRGALPIGEAVLYVLQACEAIAEAHAAGVVHRDLKPANLFLANRASGEATIKVLDFGISKAMPDGVDLGLTKTTNVMGSPFYMSPEQMRSSRNVDARTDVWALGVILYELVAGRVPFDADTMPELCALVLTEAPPPLREARPDAPEQLETAIARCLEKDAARRFADVAELASALLPLAPERGRVSVERISRVLGSGPAPVARVPVRQDAPSASTSGPWTPETTAAPPRPRAGGLVVAIAVVALVLAGVVALAPSWHHAARAAAASARQPAAPAASTALPVVTPAAASSPAATAGAAWAAASSSAGVAPAPKASAPAPAAPSTKKRPTYGRRAKPIAAAPTPAKATSTPKPTAAPPPTTTPTAKNPLDIRLK